MGDQTPEKQQATVEGRLEAVIDGHAIGWAWCPSAPEQRLAVSLVIDGVAVADGIAAGYRQSLAEAGIGDGGYVFNLPIPVDLVGAEPHEIGVLAERDGIALPPSPSFRVEAHYAAEPLASRTFAASSALVLREPPPVAGPDSPSGDGRSLQTSYIEVTFRPGRRPWDRLVPHIHALTGRVHGLTGRLPGLVDRISMAERISPAARRRLRLAALVLFLTALSWQVNHGALRAGAGLDQSWIIGLNLAVSQGIAFGSHLVFTYGPLGFTVYPEAIVPSTFVIGMLVTLATQIGLVWVLYRCLRRSFGPLSAGVLTVAAATMIGEIQADPDVAIAFGVASLALAAPESDWERAARWLAVGGGALAAFTFLIKLNDGLIAGAIIAAALLGGPRRRRFLGEFVASGFVALCVLWLAAGEPLGALPDYIRNAWEVVRGYVDAMGTPSAGATAQWQLAVLIGSGVALSVAGWSALPLAPARRRAALAVGALLVDYFLIRESFVRYSVTRGGYDALLVGAALMMPWPVGRRATGVALAAVLAVASFASSPYPLWDTFDPVGRAQRMASDMQLIVDGQYQAHLISDGKAGVREQDLLPSQVVSAVAGHCVAVAPTEIAVVWLYGFKWCPLPVLQSYTAYTTRLDDLDAAVYAGRALPAPDRVLMTAARFDDRNTSWESPAAMVALLCHFTQVAQSYTWQALVRVQDRCGSSYPLATIHAHLGQTVALPPAPSGDIVTVAFDGLGVGGLERLTTLFGRAAPRMVSVNGNSYRVPPDTAGDGLILDVPSVADYPPGFALGLNAHTIRAMIPGRAGDSITMHLVAIPIHP